MLTVTVGGFSRDLEIGRPIGRPVAAGLGSLDVALKPFGMGSADAFIAELGNTALAGALPAFNVFKGDAGARAAGVGTCGTDFLSAMAVRFSRGGGKVGAAPAEPRAGRTGEPSTVERDGPDFVGDDAISFRGLNRARLN